MRIVVLLGIFGCICTVHASFETVEHLAGDIGNESPIASVRDRRAVSDHDNPTWIGKRFRQACSDSCDTFSEVCLPQEFDPENVFYPICENHRKYQEPAKRCMDCMFQNGLKRTMPKKRQVQNERKAGKPGKRVTTPMGTTESSDTVTEKPSKRVTKPSRTTENTQSSTETEKPGKRVKKPSRTTETPDEETSTENAGRKPKNSKKTRNAERQDKITKNHENQQSADKKDDAFDARM